mgnify:CR=1 FL=1
MTSILTSIKKLIGLDETCSDFDTDIIIHINRAFMTLNQLGVGPLEGYSISGSDETWESVRNAVEQVITMINRAAQDLNEEARGIDLNKRIFQLYLEKNNDSISQALKNVRSEIRIYF